MKNQEFIKLLKEVNYSYKVENNCIIVNHEGDVDLFYLTSLPENTKFKNKGSVDLDSITSLPENTKFENKGGVNLDNNCKVPEGYLVVDNFLMKVNSSKKIGYITVYNTNFVGSNKKSFIAQKESFTAHGKTLKEAVEDLNYKILADTDQEELVNEIKQKGTITISEYRALTGACQQGVNMFLESSPIDKEKVPIKEAIKLTKGQFGNEKLIEFLK